MITSYDPQVKVAVQWNNKKMLEIGEEWAEILAEKRGEGTVKNI